MPRKLPKTILVFLLFAILLVMGAATAVAPAAEEPAERSEKESCGGFVEQSPRNAGEEDAASIEVSEVEEYWTMEDGIKLPVSVFYPGNADPAATFPLIVFVHPWDCDKLVFEETAKDYVERGYVCVTYTVRGWFGAEGQITCMDPEHELKDLSYIITLVSEDERFPVLWDERGPVVGVTGYSMGGCHTFLIAPRENPRPGDPGDQRVRAVVPMHGGADLLYSIYPNNAVKMLWGTFLLLGSYFGNMAGFLMNSMNILISEDLDAAAKFYALVDAMWKMLPPINDVTPDLAWIYGVAMQRREEDEVEAKDYFRKRSARYWCDEEYDGVVEHPIVAPMLILAGWNDDIFYANEGLKILSTCMDAPARMIITNHGHMGGMGSNFFIDLPESPEFEWISGEIERWFDHYLKGVENGVEEDPDVVFYRHDDPEDYGEIVEYPQPGTQWVSYYLGDGAGGKADLSTARPQGWFSWPDVLVNTGLTGAISLPYFQDITTMAGGEAMDFPTRIKLLEISYSECAFVTDPLMEDVTILGPPMLSIYYQSQQRFCQLIPFLYEVTPEGEQILVSRGWYEGQKLTPWALSGTAKQPVEMQAVYHRFREGSRIRLELATSDLLMTWPYFGLNFILVQHSKDAPSNIALPVIPN